MQCAESTTDSLPPELPELVTQCLYVVEWPKYM